MLYRGASTAAAGLVVPTRGDIQESLPFEGCERQ